MLYIASKKPTGLATLESIFDACLKALAMLNSTALIKQRFKITTAQNLSWSIFS